MPRIAAGRGRRRNSVKPLQGSCVRSDITGVNWRLRRANADATGLSMCRLREFSVQNFFDNKMTYHQCARGASKCAARATLPPVSRSDFFVLVAAR